MPMTEWQYSTPQERFQERAITAGAVALYGLALSQIFNPVALGVAVGYGAFKTAEAYWKLSGDAGIKRWLDKGVLQPLPAEFADAQTEVDLIADAASMPKHKVFLATEKLLLASTPFILRHTLLKFDIAKKFGMKNLAAAASTMDVVMATREFLESKTPDERRFVLAHEMAHGKVEDSSSMHRASVGFKKMINRALFYGAATFCVAGLLGFAVPSIFAGTLTTVSGLALMAAASWSADLALKYVSRIKERRADRNAIYLVGNPDGGEAFFRNANYKGEAPKPKSKYLEMAQHPSFHPRVANIKKAWEMIAAYPQSATAKLWGRPFVAALPKPVAP